MYFQDAPDRYSRGYHRNPGHDLFLTGNNSLQVYFRGIIPGCNLVVTLLYTYKHMTGE
jgi:hypothetical protein